MVCTKTQGLHWFGPPEGVIPYVQFVRRSSCIMHQFAVVGYKQAREGSESEVSDVSVDVVIYHLVGTAKEPWSVGTCGAQARG